jgi:hypothetical protein
VVDYILTDFIYNSGMTFEQGQNPYELNGSIIEKLWTDHPGTGLEFSAMSLTEAPVEIRERFLDEYAGWLQRMSKDPAVIINPRATAEKNVMYACGSAGEPQHNMDMWHEVAPDAVHPYFGKRFPEEL